MRVRSAAEEALDKRGGTEGLKADRARISEAISKRSVGEKVNAARDALKQSSADSRAPIGPATQ